MEFQIAFNFLLTNINLIQRNDLTKTKITANQNKREIAQTTLCLRLEKQFLQPKV